MSQAPSVLFVSSEVSPYIKTGDLPETAGLLSLAVREQRHDVRIMFPKYGFMSERRNRIHEITRLREFGVPMAGGKETSSCKSSSLNNARAKVQVYVLGNQTYFGRLGMNSDPHTHKEYADNGERYAYFSRAVLETCKILGWRPQIIHCFDWQSALVPAYARLLYANDGFFANTKFFFTPVSLATQGVFERAVLEAADFPASAWNEEGLVQHGKTNFVKAGVAYADYVTLGSTAVAEAAVGREGGAGLHAVFAAKKKRRLFSGIPHGLDYDVWDPARDAHLARKFSAATAGDRIENKRVFVDRQGFEFNPEQALIGVPGPLTAERGGALLLEILPDLLKQDVLVAIQAVGDPKIVDAIQKLARKHDDRCFVHTAPQDDFLHTLAGAADLMLWPAHEHPMGNRHLIALRYGALPVAAAVGTAADFIVDAGGGRGTRPNGFLAARPTAAEFHKALKRALDAWRDHATWHTFVEHAMTRDVSWLGTASQYSALYRAALKRD